MEKWYKLVKINKSLTKDVGPIIVDAGAEFNVDFIGKLTVKFNQNGLFALLLFCLLFVSKLNVKIHLSIESGIWFQRRSWINKRQFNWTIKGLIINIYRRHVNSQFLTHDACFLASKLLY